MKVTHVQVFITNGNSGGLQLATLEEFAALLGFTRRVEAKQIGRTTR